MPHDTVKNHITPLTCSGCGGCFAACPVNAIRMVPGDTGAVYPQVDASVCVSCGKCVDVCTYCTPQYQNAPQAAYAAVGVDRELVQNSTSGGIFATLAHAFIQQGGAVAGAVMDHAANGVEVYHLLSENTADIARMQGSKYVHSHAFLCYADVLNTLKQGKTVLFTGTPCQVEAVKTLSGDPAHLFTIDLICHGVPPQKMLQDCVPIWEKRFRGHIQRLNFRDKTSQKPFCAAIDIQNGKRSTTHRIRAHHLSFYQYFLQAQIYRENCYSCPYACEKRVGDITIGDYWGIEQFHGKDMENGTMPTRGDWSCVLVNTSKGDSLLQTYGAQLSLFPSKTEWVCAQNKQLQQPVSKPQNRETVMSLYRTGGWAAVEKDFIHRAGGMWRYCYRLYKDTFKGKEK